MRSSSFPVPSRSNSLCGAALAVWPDLRAIPLGFALSTLCAVGLITRSLPAEVPLDWWRTLVRPGLVGVGVYGVGSLLLWVLAG